MELERQLKILNKPSVKTFQANGDIFDCIYIYEQPALDHPLLKNHKIQMKPTFQSEVVIDQGSPVEKASLAEPLKVDCPHGTVPIRRTTKEDLIRAKSFSQSRVTNLHPTTTANPGQHVAALRPSDRNTKIYGIRAFMSTHNLDVTVDQFSTAQMWLEGGSGDQYTSLQYGWSVDPEMGGDKATRLFAYWTSDNSKSGCYNMRCPGFVQVDRNVGLGTRVNVSSDGVTRIDVIIYQGSDGNWWLAYNGINTIGYWPKELVPQLNDGATLVGWGGLASGLADGDSPPMGNGQYPHGDYKNTASMLRLQVQYAANRASGKFDIPDAERMERAIDNPKCYDLEYYGYKEDRGVSFLYGGAGGNCGV